MGCSYCGRILLMFFVTVAVIWMQVTVDASASFSRSSSLEKAKKFARSLSNVSCRSDTRDCSFEEWVDELTQYLTARDELVNSLIEKEHGESTPAGEHGESTSAGEHGESTPAELMLQLMQIRDSNGKGIVDNVLNEVKGALQRTLRVRMPDQQIINAITSAVVEQPTFRTCVEVILKLSALEVTVVPEKSWWKDRKSVLLEAEPHQLGNPEKGFTTAALFDGSVKGNSDTYIKGLKKNWGDKFKSVRKIFKNNDVMSGIESGLSRRLKNLLEHKLGRSDIIGKDDGTYVSQRCVVNGLAKAVKLHLFGKPVRSPAEVEGAVGSEELM